MTDIPVLFDPETVAAVQRLLGLGWPGPWRVVSLLGSNWGIILALGLALWLWGRRPLYALLAVVVVDGVLKTVINQALFVPRPSGGGIVPYEHVEIGSFPSGHVSTPAALWGYLSTRGLAPWTVTAIIVLAVGLSRLYLGVHYVGDVLGGILLAAVVVALVSWLWPRVRDWLAARPFRVFVGAAVLTLVGVALATRFYFGDNPYQWRAGGLVAGLAVALPIEYRYVGYRPHVVAGRRKVALVVSGLIGIGAAAAVDELAPFRSDTLGLATTALAAIWALLVVPWMVGRSGSSR